MRRKMLWLLLVFCLLLTLPLVARAQNPSPETQQAVLADLSRRVGRQLPSFDYVSSWTWKFGSYGYVVGQGGCDAAPASAPVAGDWQRYSIVYSGATFEYIVSNSGQSVILCNQNSLQQTLPTPVPTLAPTATVLAPVGAQCSLPPRLKAGERGRVTPGDPNWVHEGPGKRTAKTGEIPADETFDVLDGPRCDPATRMNYWQVRYNGLTGWTSEGQGTEYWLLPEAPAAPKRAITAANTAQLIDLNSAQVTVFGKASVYAFQPTSAIIAVAGEDGAIQLWDMSANKIAFSAQHAGGVRSIAYNHKGSLLATGGAQNNIKLWDTTQAPRETVNLPATGPVVALAFSPDDTLLAFCTLGGRVTVWNLSGAVPTFVRDLQDSGAALDVLAFSPDGSTLIGRSADGKTLRAWAAP
jgi:hypothetical protein